MVNELVKPGRKIARQQHLLTIISITIISALVFYIWGFEHAKSAVAGGLICLVPNVLFAYKAFQYAGARSSKKVVEAFFSGVKLKLALAALLFAITFKFLVIIPLAFFGTYFLVMLITLLSPIFFKL